MPFLPLHDKNPRILIALPWFTWGIIGLCCVVFWWQFSAGPMEGQRIVFALGAIPATLFDIAERSPDIDFVGDELTLITSMFLHGGLMHLIGNMLYLYVFGDNIEDAMGHLRFLAFYLICGVVAGLAHAAVDPGSEIPMVGASGAISGVLGAYLLLHPRAKVLVPIIIFPMYLPAFLLLVVWFGFQLLAAAGPDGSGVAWWAHIGGFVAGMVLVIPLKRKTVPLFGSEDYPSGLRVKRPGRGRSKTTTTAARQSKRPWD